MMAQFTVHNSQFTTNLQLTADSWKLLIESLLNVESCKLKVASGGVAYGTF